MSEGIVTLGSPTGALGLGQASEHMAGTKKSGPRGIEAVFEYNELYLNIREWVDTILVTNIAGFDDADVRDSREVNPAGHGETPFAAYYGGRTIVLSGKIVARTIFKLRDLQQAMRQAFADISQERPLYIRTNNVDTDLFINCKKSGSIQMAEEQKTANHFERAFQITLRASNPRFMSYKEVLTSAVVSLRNQFTNPSIELDLATWAANAGVTMTRENAWAQNGAWSMRNTLTAPLAANATTFVISSGPGAGGSWPITGGKTYTFSDYINRLIRDGSANVTLQMSFRDAANAVIGISRSDGSGTLPPAAYGTSMALGINREYVTAVAPANATNVVCYLLFSGGAAGGNIDVRQDSFMLHEGPLVAYFDGSIAGYMWEGAANASASVRTKFSMAVNNEGNFRAQERIRIQGKIDAPANGGIGLTIKNDTNNEAIVLKAPPGTTSVLSALNYLVIDIEKRTMKEYVAATDALVGNAFNKLDITSGWMEIEPGNNILSLTTYAATSVPSIDVRHRHTVL